MSVRDVPTYKPHILFVADEAVLREHLASALSDEYIIETAEDGEQALRAMLRNRPDLVVTDLPMPASDGLELIKALRATPSTSTIPILMISGDAPEARLHSFELGAASYLAKPYTEHDLRVRLRALLQAVQQRIVATRAEEWLHTHILQSLTEGVSVCREDGIIVFANAAEERMFGYEPGELIGKHVSIQNAYPPDENIRIVNEVLQALRECGQWSGEWHNRRKDGSTFHTRSSASALERSGERFWVCVRRDISAEKAAQSALQQSEERYRAFVSNSSEGIWRFELDPPLDLRLPIDEQIRHVYRYGVLAELNDVMARMYGYERAEQLVGAPLAKTLPPDHGALEYLRAIAAAGYSITDAESTERDRSGNVHHFVNSLVPVIHEGKLLRAWGTQREITDRKNAEERLRENERRKDEFLAILAHELRNPLAPIRNGLQILRLRAAVDPTAQRTLAMMERQMNHLVRLVDDLLDVARINTARLELKRERTSLADALASATEAIQDALAASKQELTLDMPPEPLFVYADPHRLTQIMSNLLSNAVKYSDRRTAIAVTVSREQNEAVVTVRDNGIGIPAAELKNVFEMFSQVRSLEGRAISGLGIGLALVRTLVELHGGSVCAASEGLGRGSTFTVRLPLAEPQSAPASAAASQVGRAMDARALRILVVDDNADAAVSLSFLLEAAGAKVQTAFDGEQAVQCAVQFRPQVIFMDIGMPKVDGLEATRRIRALPEGKDMHIVALTGWGQPIDRERTAQAGFDRHLVKPVSADELRNTLHAVSGANDSNA